MTEIPKSLARLPAALLVLSLAYLGTLGVLSADFGSHWDEHRLTTSVQRSLETGLLLPRWYNYPSLSYDIAMATSVPQLVMDAIEHAGDVDVFSPERAALRVIEPAFRLELRSVFFVLSILTGLAVFSLVRRLTGRPWIALFAALVLVASFEFTYHSRWAAPDCLVALCLAGSMASQLTILKSTERERQRLWTAVASIFAGLCIGAKYPGGIVLVPLLCAVFMAPRLGEPRRFHVLRRAGRALLLVGVTFIVTTPGSVIEPWNFRRDVMSELSHYGTGHGGNTVGAGWDHLSRMSAYLGGVSLSGNPVLAWSASLLALVGIAVLIRRQTRVAIWLLGVPVSYVAFMATQQVMFARNYMLLLPFAAMFAAIGLAFLIDLTENRKRLRLMVCSAAVFFVGFNMVAVTKTSLDIMRPTPPSKGAALESRLASAPGEKFCLSPRTRELLGAAAPVQFPNVVESWDRADRMIFLSTEVENRALYEANVAGRYRTLWARAEEVNWDYYPAWVGHPRILEVSATEPALRPLLQDVAGAAPPVNSDPRGSMPRRR